MGMRMYTASFSGTPVFNAPIESLTIAEEADDEQHDGAQICDADASTLPPYIALACARTARLSNTAGPQSDPAQSLCATIRRVLPPGVTTLGAPTASQQIIIDMIQQPFVAANSKSATTTHLTYEPETISVGHVQGMCLCMVLSACLSVIVRVNVRECLFLCSRVEFLF